MDETNEQLTAIIGLLQEICAQLYGLDPYGRGRALVDRKKGTKDD